MLRQKIQAHCKVIKSLEINETKIKSISKKITNQILKGGKLLFCGNGGSAADSQHLAAEFTSIRQS